jgi:peptide chain release factor subunit 1
LSVYLGVQRGPEGFREAQSSLHSLLEPAKREANSDELGHEGRNSLRADLAQVSDLVNELRSFQGWSLAVFACHSSGLYEQILLPRLVRDLAVLDETPYVRPALSVLDESHRYCVAVVDREHARLFVFWMGELDEQEKAHGKQLRHPRSGGWRALNEPQVQHRVQQLTRQHFRESAQTIETVMQESRADLLIPGGHEEVIADFLPFLPGRLEARLAGTFVIDPNTMSPGQVREKTQVVVDDYERDEERRLVAQAMRQVATRGWGAAGIEWCIPAVNEQAVQVLLIHDDVQQAGRVCDRCGWIGLSDEECPVCGASTRASADIIDELAAAVIDASGQVKHVYAATILSQHTLAALLRFPVPPPYR